MRSLIAAAFATVALCAAEAETVGEFTILCRAKVDSLPTATKGDTLRKFYSFGDGAWELTLVWNTANGAPYRQVWTRFNHVEADGSKRLFAIYQRDLDGLAAGEWMHFAVTYSVAASTMRLYMNGFLIGERKRDYDNRIALAPLERPASFPEGRDLKDVKFLPRVMDESEIFACAGVAAAKRIPSGRPFEWGSFEPTSDRRRFMPTSEIPADFAGKPLAVVAAKGEIEPCSVLVRCGRDLKGLVPVVGALKSADGNQLPADAVDVRVVKVAPTAVIYPSVRGSRTLKPMMLLHDDSLLRVNLETRRADLKLRTPDGFRYVQSSDAPGDDYVKKMVEGHKWLNVRYDAAEWPVYDAKTIQPLDLAADTLKQYWFTVRVPSDAAAGEYRAEVVFRDACGARLASVPLSVRVLPFRLPEPRVKYDTRRPYRRMLYTRHKNTDFEGKTAGSITTDGRNVDQFRADLRNIREHGIESATIMMDLKLPRWRWFKWGKHDGPSAGEFESRPGRVDRDYSVKALRVLAEEGLVSRPLYVNNGCNFGFREGYAPESKANLTSLVDATKSILREALGHDEMCVYAVDEAKGDAIDRQRAAWDELHAQGVRVYATCLPKNVGRVVANGADAVVQSVKPTKENAALVHGAGGVILSYAYPQSGAKDDAFSYRANYGFGDWLSDYDGFSLYCWDEFSGNPWNEFENWGGKSYIYVFLTADGVVDTPSWEGQREAVDDVRYATLLRMMDDPDANAWLDSVDPFAADFNPAAVRSGIIERILRIRGMK